MAREATGTLAAHPARDEIGPGGGAAGWSGRELSLHVLGRDHPEPGEEDVVQLGERAVPAGAGHRLERLVVRALDEPDEGLLAAVVELDAEAHPVGAEGLGELAHQILVADEELVLPDLVEDRVDWRLLA